MWLVLLIGASEAVGFRGGLGATLASVHLLTLGEARLTSKFRLTSIDADLKQGIG